jgi:hypothetical protein
MLIPACIVGPLPVIDGVVVPAVSAPARAPAPITTLPSILPPLQSTDRTKFLSLFNKNNPIGGLLNGKADALTKSKPFVFTLPQEMQLKTYLYVLSYR